MSAFAQSDRVSVVLVDDGCRDPETLAIIEEGKAEGCSVIRHAKNRGVGAALQSGCAAATTEYLLPMGSDDILQPALAQKATKILDDQPDTRIVSCWLENFGEYSGVYAPIGAPRGVEDLLFKNTIPGASVFRRADWRAVGGFRTNLRWGEDWELWVRILALGGTCQVIPEPLYRYRRHPEQATASIPPDVKHADHLEIVRANGQVWGRYGSIVMDEYWKQQEKNHQLEKQLRLFRHRYGAINEYYDGAARIISRGRRAYRTVVCRVGGHRSAN